MKYLLDVNALVALGLIQHEFHERVTQWVTSVAATESPELATCSITELGFVRILAQAPGYGLTVADACNLLQRLKRTATVKFTFVADNQDASHLPAWAKTAKQTTDGHLLELARASGAVLATLDSRIPNAFQIPSR
jgi:predicted nucleic acid-binding protein